MKAYKIYFDEHQILIIPPEFVAGFENKMVIWHNTPADLDLLVFLVKNHKINGDVMLISDKPKNSYACLKLKFTYVAAAGGIVRNNKGQILCILKNGKWDLPKGKIDKGETKKQAALREVKEECGLTSLTLGKKISKTYHIAKIKGRYVCKKTTWYEIFDKSDKHPVPDHRENITDVKWFDTSEKWLSGLDTFRNIRELLQEYLKY
jgi:8-oxo-dGTP pyrophosphatase MutT (NUDIX family)